MSVTIRVGAELLINGLPAVVDHAVTTANTFGNPAFDRRQRLGLWTGDTDETIALYRRTATGLVVPRGTFPLVIRLCREAGLAYQVVDETIAPPLDTTVTVSGALFSYQQQALDTLLRWPTGLLKAPTGSGKTNILLSAIPRLHTPTLILVHTAELLRQTQDRCQMWLGVEPGTLGGGRWDVRPISVGMIQTLAKRDLREIAAYFGCVLVDECHHAPARTWADVLNRLPSRFKYGMTATPWRKDGLQMIMWRTLSTVTATVDQADVTRASKTITPDIETIPTGFHFKLVDSLEWGRMITALVRDTARNALIVDEVRAHLTPHTRALVLTDRVEHAHHLARLLDTCQPVVLTGELTKTDREAAMVAVRAGASLTIATSALLGEGIDVPGWDLLFLATPMAGGPRTVQAVGRVSRAAPGKARATVIDFVDVAVPALACAHSQRERLYREVQSVA